MREILFRAKRIGDGKWFEGYYCGGTEDKTISPCIFEYLGGMKGYDYHNIILDTLGQYTGLTDKNGNKIFEGDLLKDDSGFIHEVIFDGGCFMRKYGLTSHLMATTSCVMEVIGNIHDNADLLMRN